MEAQSEWPLSTPANQHLKERDIVFVIKNEIKRDIFLPTASRNIKKIKRENNNKESSMQLSKDKHTFSEVSNISFYCLLDSITVFGKSAIGVIIIYCAYFYYT